MTIAACEHHPRALVLEDEAEWRDLIVAGLSALGLEVSLAARLSEARTLAASRAPDLLVIDRHLAGGEEGLDLLIGLPAPPWRPAVLVLSQLGSTEARVHGLDAGADDYLVKPFDTAELRARVAALLRRRAPAHTDVTLSLWGLELDLKSRQLIWREQPHSVGDQAFALLVVLLRASGDSVSLATLWREVWPQFSRLDPAEGVIQVAISRLRAHLVAITGRRWVQGVRGRGYRIGPDDAD